MSAPTASKKNKRTSADQEQSGFKKFRVAAKGWPTALVASFVAVLLASAVEFFFPIPVWLSTALTALPVIATAFLIRDSFWKLAARMTGVIILVNIIYADYSLVVYLLGMTWVLRRAWVDGNRSGENYRLIGFHRKLKESLSSRIKLSFKTVGI